MAVNYADPMGSVEAEKRRKEAQEGKIPEGEYLVKLMSAKYGLGQNPEKGLYRWELKVRFIMPNPKDVFHRAERLKMYFDTEARWAEGQMETFFQILKKMGLNLSRGGDVSDPRDIEEWLDRAIEEGCQFKLLAEDAFKWDPINRVEIPNEKYPNNFTILLDSVPAVITKIKAKMASENAGSQAPGVYEAPADEGGQEEGTPDGDAEGAEASEPPPPPPPPRAAARGPWARK